MLHFSCAKSHEYLYYGDNPKILREYIKDETVDLIYLDPPLNSNRNYNVLFKDESGVEADSQITAFEDTSHWNASAEETYRELLLVGDEVSTMWSMRGSPGRKTSPCYGGAHALLGVWVRWKFLWTVFVRGSSS